jgi:hypothetical protein
MSGMVEIKRKNTWKWNLQPPPWDGGSCPQKSTLLHKYKLNHSTSAALILTILYSEMLKLQKKSPTTKFCEILNLYDILCVKMN